MAAETEYGDIGIDGADRLYKNVLGTWVAQGRSSTPVHPVKIIARWRDGEYHAFEATREEKLREALGKAQDIIGRVADNYAVTKEELNKVFHEAEQALQKED